MYQFAIDRGGTFTDVWSKSPSGNIRVLKLLSEDPQNYDDAPREAIKRIIEDDLREKFQDGIIDTKTIEWIRMGTTVATNALLERKGERCALLVTKGFRDLLYIGNQSRPNLFDLSCRSPEMLYEKFVEVDERVLLDQSDCQLGLTYSAELGSTGEKVFVQQKLNEESLKENLREIYAEGIRSLAVVLMHSYMYKAHELRIKEIAGEMGFSQISLSSEVMDMVRIVPRGYTACVDAYLTPCIRRYVNGFAKGFKRGLTDQRVLFMQSDGGLTPVDRFFGSRAIVSGPAGGVVGYALTTYARLTDLPIVGFDMGGTSTDVSRFAGSYEHVFESQIAGVTIQAPQLDINTVAAGGGSRLFFRSGMFVVGPESAGAHPGPVCYRKGGYLTVTDANLLLGRIIPDFFPNIFGPNENEPLDLEATVSAFNELTEQINNFLKTQGKGEVLTREEVAMGFLRVANETMCRPIRALTQGKGYDTSRHALAVFGGAGGQHACAVAKSLGIRSIFIHKYAGILSAYGLALADVVHEAQEPSSLIYEASIFEEIDKRIDSLIEECETELKSQGFSKENIICEPFLHLRYQGTDCALMTSCGSKEAANAGGSKYGDFGGAFIERAKGLYSTYLRYRNVVVAEAKEGFSRKLSFVDNLVADYSEGVKLFEIGQITRSEFKLEKTFLWRRIYKTEFGFTLPDRAICVDDIRVRGVAKSGVDISDQLSMVSSEPREQMTTTCYFEEGSVETPVFLLTNLGYGHEIKGPAIIIDQNSTILIEPHSVGSILKTGDIQISIGKQDSTIIGTELDAIQLSIFSHRFMSTAEQMGRILQRTAISTNIKERLDFSCALFGPDGGLVANAPHIPVHLGAMQSTVQYQMKHLEGGFKRGEVILTNHPSCGGSHLPDLTVITPVFYSTMTEPIFYVANRGHHADIGGNTPGSMPPHSKSIKEEGAVFESFRLVIDGVFQEEAVIEALMAPKNNEGCSGTRNLSDNLSDLKAQIAANQKGIQLITELIEEYSLPVVQAYMKHIQENAEVAVRELLKNFAKTVYEKFHKYSVSSEDYMDDGSVLRLQVRLDQDSGSATFDFTGTTPQVLGNTNTPRAVTQSSLIYCLRCMVGYDIPLNQGCLKPVTTVVPDGTFISPGPEAAVVGGNVLTSQRLVDVIFKALSVCAASQGCMNNTTFGDGKVGYYETVAGGAGAGPDWPGRSGIHTHMTNTRITDPEILERRYPVILEAFHLRKDSGGSGAYRGGDGVIRKLTFRRPLTLSVLTERRVNRPYGMNGGEPGLVGLNILQRKNDKRSINIGAKTAVEVEPGDTFILMSPGGGGYGSTEGNKDADTSKIHNAEAISRIKGSVHDYLKAQESA